MEVFTKITRAGK